MNKNHRSILIQTNSLSSKYGGGSTGLISIGQAFGRNKSIKTFSNLEMSVIIEKIIFEVSSLYPKISELLITSSFFIR